MSILIMKEIRKGKTMYGYKDLKPNIIVSDNQVECPVKDCNYIVERQRRNITVDERHKCPKHRIFISPSTFKYESENDNMLWTNSEDLKLFSGIKKVKRERRITHDNSEDALTWNVFRFLDTENILGDFLSNISGQQESDIELIFWSYSPHENAAWSRLNKARLEFGELLRRSSEPDIIVKTKEALFFIETKFQAPNKVTHRKPSVVKKYLTGGDCWFEKVFRSPYETIAIKDHKYELMRFWLLGTWMAAQAGVPFYLVNLVQSEKEQEIESQFGKHILQTNKNIFIRKTWDDVIKLVCNSPNENEEKDKMINYLKNKTVGYNSRHELKKAFRI